MANLREAVTLHLEGDDPSTFGLAPNPTILLTMELETIHAEVEAVTRSLCDFFRQACHFITEDELHREFYGQ